MSVLPTVERPAHVPEALVHDFDFFRPGPEGSDPFRAWATLHGLPPLVWTPRNGGHWIVTRGEDVPRILSDWERFSSSRAFIGMVERPKAVPLEYDPPEHAALRKLLVPAFTPKAVKRWSEEAERLTIELIEGFRANGRCEFMADFAMHLPMIIFMMMVDLPLEHREKLTRWVSTGLRSTDEAARIDARANLNAYIADLVDTRTATPGDDLLSQAIHADLGQGQPMSRIQAMGLASGLLGGGLDTVAATMGWMALHLAENPEQRRALAAEPKRIPKAIEELMRRYSIANIARVVRDDMEYEGAPLKAGEQVLLSACIHGLDARSFACPMDVDFARRDSYKHSTLSHGIHRCIGAPLAAQEMKIFLEQWLARIPDYEVDPANPPVMATGIVHGLTRLGLRWKTA
ncbi:MAG: Cytochrome [Sphingomonas bacterium]|nr:Cytochrome [Sphingomonas bacterium]